VANDLIAMIFDAHLDLALNAIEWNRDLTQSVTELRRREEGMTDKPDRGRGVVSLPEMRRGGIGLCVTTQIARVKHDAYSPISGWRSPAQAWAMTQAQLAWYRAMEEAGEMVQIRDRAGLERHLELWKAENVERPTSNIEHRTGLLPIGYILSLEGADSLISVRHLERSVADGLRAIGPAHYGPGIYANGTDATGGFNARGRELIREIERLGLILDVTHLCDDCFWEALHLFSGPLWASHHNCRAIVPHNRQLSDEMIRALVERGAVIGAALDAWMILPNWLRGKTTPEATGIALRHVVDHIDHVCQVAGSAANSGIGSDLDGAFGREQTPQDIETIADLASISELLRQRGYSDADVDNIMHGNFVRCLREAWR
jgi:membrane dipeptidase